MWINQQRIPHFPVAALALWATAVPRSAPETSQEAPSYEETVSTSAGVERSRGCPRIVLELQKSVATSGRRAWPSGLARAPDPGALARGTPATSRARFAAATSSVLCGARGAGSSLSLSPDAVYRWKVLGRSGSASSFTGVRGKGGLGVQSSARLARPAMIVRDRAPEVLRSHAGKEEHALS